MLTSPLKIKNRSSALVKLFQPNLQQFPQVQHLRKVKARMRQYEYHQNQLQRMNMQLRKRDHLQKKSCHQHCVYHTYDYQANLMKVSKLKLEIMKGPQGQIQAVQPTLMQQLSSFMQREKKEQDEIQKINKLMQKQRKKKPVGVDRKHKIQDQEKDQQILKERVPAHLRPLFGFQQSKVVSLSQGIDNMLETGVKIQTNQTNIVPDSTDTYILDEKKVIKQKNKKKDKRKQKTNSSQSVIYALGKDLMSSKHTQQIDQSSQSRQLGQYHSHQLGQNYPNSEGELNRKISQQLIDPQMSPINMFKLPRLPRNKTNPTSSSRVIRGLAHIQIDSIPQRSRFSNRQRAISGLSQHKKTQSSLNADYIGKNRQYLQEYFSKYHQQYRQRKSRLQKIFNLEQKHGG